jgi:hypothetical protein
MNSITADRRRAAVVRLLTDWTVPSLGISQASSARCSRAWFLEHITRFLGIDAPPLVPQFAARLTFCVEWCHHLMSLNLVSNLLMPVSGRFAVAQRLTHSPTPSEINYHTGFPAPVTAVTPATVQKGK